MRMATRSSRQATPSTRRQAMFPWSKPEPSWFSSVPPRSSRRPRRPWRRTCRPCTVADATRGTFRLLTPGPRGAGVRPPESARDLPSLRASGHEPLDRLNVLLRHQYRCSARPAPVRCAAPLLSPVCERLREVVAIGDAPRVRARAAHRETAPLSRLITNDYALLAEVAAERRA